MAYNTSKKWDMHVERSRAISNVDEQYDLRFFGGQKVRIIQQYLVPFSENRNNRNIRRSVCGAL